MSIDGGFPGFTGPDPVRMSRADTIRRWASEGARAFENLQRESTHVSDRPHPVLCGESWFGSDGKRTGYSQEGVKKMLPHVIIRRNLVASCLHHYGTRFARIKVNRACQILRQLGCGDDQFCWVRAGDSMRFWNANQFLAIEEHQKSCKFPLNNWYARIIFPISFQGGPPNNWGTQSGNLLTLLLDRIAVMVLLEGVEVLDGIIAPDEHYSKFI